MDDDPFAKQISFHAQIYENLFIMKIIASHLSQFSCSSFQPAGEFLMYGLLALSYHLQTYEKLPHQFRNPDETTISCFGLKLFFGKLFHNPLSNPILLPF